MAHCRGKLRAGVPVDVQWRSRDKELSKRDAGQAAAGDMKQYARSALLAKGLLAERPFAIRNKNELRLYT
jgi:hypothetical protein